MRIHNLTSARYVRPIILILSLVITLASVLYSAGVSAHSTATESLHLDNQPPVAQDSSYSMHIVQAYIGPFSSYDPDGDPLTASIITQPSHGTLYTNDFGPLRPWYSPVAGYAGDDSFVYQICDPSGACATGTITVHIVNQAPVASPSTISVHTSGYIGYFSSFDPDGDGLSATIVTPPVHGTLYTYDYGALRPWYTPDPGFSGFDTLTFQVCDPFQACSSAMVTIQVVNQAPVAKDALYRITTDNGGYIGYSFSWDPDGDSLSSSIVSPPSHGTVYTYDYGALRPWYAPNPGYKGPDSFVYQICDPFNACASGTIYINDDDANAGAVSCNANVGGPINVTNGNMYLHETDYRLPGIGAAIDITRTYNSNSQHVNLFGRGWSSAYDEAIRTYSNANPRLFLPDGRAIDFSGSGTLSPVQGDFHAQLLQNGDGSYTLTFKDGRVHQFNPAGKLLSLADRNNNQTALGYDTGGNLASVTDPSGRVLAVTTNTNGRILSISGSVGVIATYAYGSGDNLASVTYADNSGHQFSYNSTNLLTSVTDALGHVLEAHAYDSSGRALTSERQAGVELVTLNYVSNTETDVTDALGHVTKYFFDKSQGRNLVTRVEGSCGCGGGAGAANVQTWTYDNQLNVLTETNALNQTTAYTYDANGNRLTKTDVLGTAQYTYNQFGQVLTATDALGAVTTLAYDAQGNVLTLTNALNKATAFAYDPRGQLLSITDARSKVSSFAYDPSGNLVQTTDALGHAATFAYDLRGRLASETNVLGHTTAYDYDAVGRLSKVTQPNDSFVTFTYDLAGRRTSLKDARGNSTTFVYDDADRLISETDAAGGVIAYGYDLMSNLTSRTNALGHMTNYEYDELNRLAKIIYPPAATGTTRLEERVEYDAAGNPTKRIDTAGRETRYEYDGANRLIKTIDPAQQATQYEYNALSEMTAVVDALGQRYVFVYDPLGRPKRMRRGGLSMTFTYDAVGNRKQRTDYNGATTVYTYNALNRLTEVNYPDTTTVAYSYDKLGRLKTATNEHGTVSFTYNRVNRLTSATDVFGQVLDYSYDLNGNRTKATLNAATLATYRYDEVNRLTRLIDAAGAATTYTYDAAGRPISRRLPNGVVTTQEYDGVDRLARLKHAKGANIIADNQYQYNAASQISQIAEPAATREFAYDPTDRLTVMTSPTLPGENYAYDAVGNRTNSHLSTSYTHQPVNKLTQTSTASYSYDNNGNLTSKTDASGTWAYTWDFENRLKQVTRPDGASVVYRYDALGRRIQRTPSNGVSSNFTYDGQDVVLDQNSDGSTVRYLNGPGFDNKLRQTSGAGALYFIQDHLGSTRALTDSSGNVVETTNYDSFGNGASNLTRYGYTGREWDAEAGLYYYRNRSYDPQAGRFISEDPAGFRGSLNWYSYAENSPLKYTDPLGLAAVAIYDRSQGLLFVTEIGGPSFIQVHEFSGIFSGDDECRNSTTCDAEKDKGPIPAGVYLIDDRKDIRFTDWRQNGYRLYRSLNADDPLKGPFEDDYAPVTDPFTGRQVSRGGFYLHAGLVSLGCVTFPADQRPGEPGYPSSTQFGKLDAILKRTPPYEYVNQSGVRQKFSGGLVVLRN